MGRKVLIKKLHPDAVIPAYQKAGDAGFDLCAVETVTVLPGRTAIVPTGLAIAVPDGYEAQIRMRSGASLKTPLILPNAPATIDSGYRGELGIIVRNVGSEPYTVEKGARIAQGVLAPVERAEFEESRELPPSERGCGGYGSTGDRGAGQRFWNMHKQRQKMEKAMKVLLVNGSPHTAGSTHTALSAVAGQLEAAGIETEIMQIGSKDIRGCIACGKCRETGLCIFKNDPVNEGIEKLRAADGLVVGSPVYYAGPNATLCAFLDRVFFLKSAPYAWKPAASVVSCRRGGASASFDRLNKYFTIARMPIVSSQYWNSIHGNNAEEAGHDLEGLQTMRTLGSAMAWLLKCIAAGGKAGVEPPVSEPAIFTNFIR